MEHQIALGCESGGGNDPSRSPMRRQGTTNMVRGHNDPRPLSQPRKTTRVIPLPSVPSVAFGAASKENQEGVTTQ